MSKEKKREKYLLYLNVERKEKMKKGMQKDRVTESTFQKRKRLVGRKEKERKQVKKDPATEYKA